MAPRSLRLPVSLALSASSLETEPPLLEASSTPPMALGTRSTMFPPEVEAELGMIVPDLGYWTEQHTVRSRQISQPKVQ
jgi:hypothetical protein